MRTLQTPLGSAFRCVFRREESQIAQGRYGVAGAFGIKLQKIQVMAAFGQDDRVSQLDGSSDATDIGLYPVPVGNPLAGVNGIQVSQDTGIQNLGTFFI